MKDELISLFIDDEMDIDNKIAFVDTVHSDPVFTEKTLDLLKQEKLIVSLLSGNHPRQWIFPYKYLRSFQLPFKTLTTILATAFAIMSIVWPEVKHQKVVHQFALSEPYVEQAEISGNLTREKPLHVILADRNRYWKYQLDHSPSENEYSFFLDWKISTANLRAQFRDNLKSRTYEMPNVSLN
jgi:hypothetical protein